MSIANLEELLVEEVRDLYDAEKQLLKALPKMAKGASDEELREAFQMHLEETKGQVARLEQVFEMMGAKAKGKPCQAMKGLVEEAQEHMQEEVDEESITDAMIIGSAQKVEHYEIAGYGTARTLALAAGNKEVASLLQETLDEEGATDKKLTAIAKRMLKELGRGRPEEIEEDSETARRGSRGGGRGGRTMASGAGGGGGQEEEMTMGSGGGRGQKKKQVAAKSAKSGGGQSRKRGSGESGGSSRSLTGLEEIRQWAEERGGRPACVRGTGGSGDIGMIRIDFPGYSGEDSLEEISWDEWYEKFEESGLALLVQETTAGGETSNFNKLVSRENPKVRAAG